MKKQDKKRLVVTVYLPDGSIAVIDKPNEIWLGVGEEYVKVEAHIEKQ